MAYLAKICKQEEQNRRRLIESISDLLLSQDIQGEHCSCFRNGSLFL